MGLTAIRGAAAPVENGREEILKAARELFAEILKVNQLSAPDITALIFSATPDLTAAYPAQAIREMGYSGVPMLCVAEMAVNGSLANCLRVMVFINSKLDRPRHVYQGAAKSLRPDWSGHYD